MNVQSVLLGFLMRRSMTGYELKKFFSISFSFFSGLSYGSIYPALSRMAKEGLVTMRLERQGSAPSRKVYTITHAGRDAFLDSLKVPLTLESPKSTFLMRLFFFADLSPQERKACAGKYLESVRAAQGALEEARPQVQMVADRYQLLCFQFGLRFFQDLARNVEGVMRALEEEDPKS
jgi:DNA-binding PadR family transcriptional regulator